VLSNDEVTGEIVYFFLRITSIVYFTIFSYLGPFTTGYPNAAVFL
jgi:hypothetical protein